MKYHFLIAATMFFSLINFNPLIAQTSIDNPEIVQRLENFYADYITLIAEDDVDYEKLAALKNEYCTSRLLKKIEEEELEYDPFINAQDTDISWLESLSIRSTDTTNNIYLINFPNSYGDIEVVLTLIKRDNVWEIDDIKGI